MKTSNRMKLQFDSRSANESFARMAVSAFIAPLDPTVDELLSLIHIFPPATGTGSGSPWTKAVPKLSGKCLSSCMRRASSTGASGSSTGAPTA